MAATLDGLVKETGAVFEAKFMCPGRSRKKPCAFRGIVSTDFTISPHREQRFQRIV
jgi:hypothetical protein